MIAHEYVPIKSSHFKHQSLFLHEWNIVLPWIAISISSWFILKLDQQLVIIMLQVFTTKCVILVTWHPGVGVRCLLVTAMVWLPPAVLTCTWTIFSSAWFKLTWYPGQTYINTHSGMCTSISWRHTTNSLVCLSHTLLSYTSNAVVTSMQDRKAIEVGCTVVENGRISSCQWQWQNTARKQINLLA